MNPTDSPRRRRKKDLPPSPLRGRGAGGEGPSDPPVVGGRGADLPRWADALLTLWVAIVAVVYFGGYFWPEAVGVYTATGRTFYAALLLVAAVNLTLRYLNRAKNDTDDTQGHAHED